MGLCKAMQLGKDVISRRKEQLCEGGEGEGLGTQVGTGARGVTLERLPKQSALQCTASISNNCVT